MAKRFKGKKGTKISEKKPTESDNMTNASMTTEKSDSARESIKNLRKTSEISKFNKYIFNDPFFTDPFDEMYHFHNFDELANRAKEMTRKAIRNENKAIQHIDTSRPGTYATRSTYRTSTQGSGRTPKGEVITNESITNVDEKGRKFTERWKSSENVETNIKKTTHSRLIGDKGIQEMKTHHFNTGEEYEHTNYKNMSQKDAANFNTEFDKGIRGARATTAISSGDNFTSLVPFERSSLDRPSTFDIFDNFRRDWNRLFDWNFFRRV